MTIKGKISQYSNDQVKVKAVDMLSLNPYIREIQEKILNKKYQDKQYFLEIYSSGKKSYYEVSQNLFEKNHIIALSDFLKLYFSTQNKQDLGAWKNTFNTQVEKTNINESFDLNKSLKICDTIRIYEDFLLTIDSKKKKDDLKSADLAFKYLICQENFTPEEAMIIIDKINKVYFYDLKEEKSKLIDVYKSPSIINKLEQEIKIFKMAKAKISKQ